MTITSHWVSHIEAWQGSGQSQASYCRQQGINPRTFAARLSDYRKSQQVTAPALIPVQVITSTPTAEPLVLSAGGNYRLEMPLTTSASWLAELLRCLD
jgi:hypothetical protein